MDASELEKYHAWAKNYWKQGPCPVCKTTPTKWRAGGEVAWLRPADAKASESYPMLIIYCENCGYTLQINSRVAGITP
jgi:hypothetical protein